MATFLILAILGKVVTGFAVFGQPQINRLAICVGGSWRASRTSSLVLALPVVFSQNLWKQHYYDRFSPFRPWLRLVLAPSVEPELSSR